MGVVLKVRGLEGRSAIEPSPAKVNNPAEVEESPQTNNIAVVFGFLRTIVITILHLCWVSLRAAIGYTVRHPYSTLFNAFLLAIMVLVVITGSNIHEQMILGKISDRTVDKIIHASRYTHDYDSEQLAARGIREFVGVGGPEWAQREGIRAVLFHARRAGLSIEHQAVLLATVEVESGFNPMARAPTTTACGLFQFVKATGKAFGLDETECMNPWQNARAGIEHYMHNFDNRVRAEVEGLTGPEQVFRTYELSYYLHHDGPMSSNPADDVKAVVLSGTQFLFRVYGVLKEDSESRQAAPTFTQQFAENLWEVMDQISAFFSSFGTPAFAASRVRSDSSPEQADALAAEAAP